MTLKIRALKIMDYSKEDVEITYVVKIGGKISIMSRSEFNSMINGGLFGNGTSLDVVTKKISKDELDFSDCQLFSYCIFVKKDFSILDEKTIKFYFETIWNYEG